MKRSSLVLTGIIFYVGWFGSVFLAKTSYGFCSTIFPLALVSFLFLQNMLSRKLFFIGLFVSFAGFLIDSLFMQLGLVSVAGQSGGWIPLWLFSIWLLFSYSMLCLGHLFKLPYWVIALLGFIMGPLSYMSGEIFQVLAFLTPFTFWVYAVFWGITFPFVVYLSKRYKVAKSYG